MQLLFNGNKSVQNRIAWTEILFFILGKIIVFSLFGLIVWMLGSEVKSTLKLYFPWFRKVVGPILILIGLFMLGIIKFYKSFSLGSIPERLMKKGNLGAFLMGYTYNYGLINEIHIFDGKLDKFRYPIDKHLDYHFKKQKKYDIESFNKFFYQILTFLNGVSGMDVHHKEMQAEYEMEMRSWYDE